MKKSPPRAATRASPPKKSAARRRPRQAAGPQTLAIDIGGTGLKAAVLGPDGAMISERVRVDTPHPCTPQVLVDALVALVQPLPAFERVSVGFPGLIRHGVVVTAPNLSTEAFAGFDLVTALRNVFHQPVRATNDADMQGMAVVKGQGVEMVVTLGTGFGTALFRDGLLQVHLEIAHHPFVKDRTYDEMIGDAHRKEIGNKKWIKLVKQAIKNMRTMVNFDHLYLGGGNAQRLDSSTLSADISIVDNAAGILGGIRLWDKQHHDV